MLLQIHCKFTSQPRLSFN